MANSHQLSGLTEREAIADALYRAASGIDSNDRALWDSAWVTNGDAAFELNGQEIKGEALQNIFETAAALDTTHHISNLRISVEEDANTATATATGLHQHFRAGEGPQVGTPHLLAGGRYNFEFQKDGQSGIWRMKKWGFALTWKDGDNTVTRGR